MERRGRMSGWLRRRPHGSEGAFRTARTSRSARRAHALNAADAARREELLLAAAAAGFPVALAAHPAGEADDWGLRCSCDRVGCPTPGTHPVSFAWQTQASTDAEQVARWLRDHPRANFVTATGIGHDVLDVPAAAGRIALERLAAAILAEQLAEQTAEQPAAQPQPAPPAVGPVASLGPGRMLFFTATRGTPDDEDEWWPCELDCHPETLDDHPGLRWHCRGSYVLLPPSRLPDGSAVEWLRPPHLPLPDPLWLLETLTDACAQVVRSEEDDEGHVPLPYR